MAPESPFEVEPSLVRRFVSISFLADIASRLGAQDRITTRHDGRAESVTDHTVMLALFVMALGPSEGIDIGRAVRYAVVHDLPEFLFGDVPTLRALGDITRARKNVSEEIACAAICDASGDVDQTIADYEAQADREARFVHIIDKALPKLTHAWDSCRVVKLAGMTRGQLAEGAAKQHAALAEKSPDLEVALAFHTWAVDLMMEAW